jgi:hypothetical protein
MRITTLTLAAAFAFATCSNDTSENTDNDTLKGDSASVTVEVNNEGSKTTLPSPLRVAMMFQRSGLKFIPGITFGSDKAINFSTKFQKVRIMGVYSSDLAYTVLNKQSNESQKLLKTIREVAGQIDLGKVFDQTNLFDRFNANLDNTDSLGSIIGDIQYQTDLQLQEGGQTEMYGIIFSGAWVEAMYIGAQVYKKEGNDNVVVALLEQMAVLKSILEELNSYDTQDADLKAWITELSAMQTIVDAMPSMKKLNENPELEFKDVKPTSEEMAPVIQKIEELRAAIVKG